MLLSLIAFQTLLAVIYASTMFSQLKLGEISGLTFLASALASVLLVVGGLLYVFRIRYASYLFFASAFFAAFVYWQWRPTFVFTGLAISVCAGLVSIAFQRRFASA